eukprot:6595329-Alexandrium_andersonii.AAC.1
MPASPCDRGLQCLNRGYKGSNNCVNRERNERREEGRENSCPRRATPTCANMHAQEPALCTCKGSNKR